MPSPGLVVVHDTLRTVIHDTTVVHDTLSIVRGAVPNMLDVRVHDSLGGKDLGTWVVQLVVALGAALLGAYLGGKSARIASLEAIREEHRLEREHAVRRLQARIRSNLRRVQLLCEKHAGHNPDTPLDPMVGEELEVVWNLYYRVAEPIFTLEAANLSERLDSYFVKTHIAAEAVKSLEAWARDITAVAHESQKYRDTHKAREALPRQRQEVTKRLAELGSEARQLLGELAALGQ